MNDDIKFNLIFVNSSNKKEYKVSVDRWKNNNTYDLSDEFDYSDAWFKGYIDLSEIPVGDYDIYMESIGKNSYTRTLFDNIMNNPMKRRAVIGEKNYSFNVAQGLKSKAISLSVRKSLITSSESPTFRNMINDYNNIDFKNNMMNISGTSYNYGGNYSDSSNIKREIIFENTLTFDQYKFELGSTNKGSYEVTSFDKLSKEYSWFNKSIDVSNLPKGTYSMIIHTKAFDVDDYGDLVDMFGSADANSVINSKSYRITTNSSRNDRLELIIK